MTTNTTTDLQISINEPLTKITTSAIVENVPSPQTTRHNYKQTFGGNVTITQPPALCGFFMPATIGDCTILPGVASTSQYRQGGQTCSVPSTTFRSSLQSYDCQHSKQTTEVNAMHNATTNAIRAPSPTAKGLTHHSSNPRALIDSNLLLDSIIEDKAKRSREERGAGYQRLLRAFHSAILPAYLSEAGSISEAAQMLGLHRETLAKHMHCANIKRSRSVGGAV